ncbi:vWA domain-containing protein [Sandaracinus amylolyticus]|uniref:vWA domain-containing protein n=1 Tax=Sandaracinus amylolyticus TaxID=927083 RepID=UPI001F173AB9|nr:vWA domain-containing protein [Sandaracinus amylolyticus]UJR79657.1 Hypothetical protein I5071_16950 [Sandaracinus amylolyticus]
MTRDGLVVLGIIAALASGCDAAGATYDACGAYGQCGGGRTCIDGRCVMPPSQGDLDGGAPRPDAGPCRAITAESTARAAPVDIVIAIDNSGSMSEEAAQVRRNINTFASILGASGLDYRVVLISRPDGDRGVCVPVPLGSGEPDCTSGPEGRLLAIHDAVGSDDAIDLVIEHYPDYRDFLRPNAAKAFLWITDDESGTFTADAARDALAALEPSGMLARTIHNSIVGHYGETPTTWADDAAGDCESLADPGETYMRLTQCLDDANEAIPGCIAGRSGRVCETDWTAIFESIARGVVEGVPVPCDFALPDAPAGAVLDHDAIRITYSAGDGSRHELVRAAGPGACTAEGWHFDDGASPTAITLCPELCRTVQSDEDARLDIGLGCFPLLE